MFDDGRGLNSAVKTGRKNMTRRLEKCLQDINEDYKSPFVDYEFDEYNAESNTILAKRYWRGHFNSCCDLHPRFKVGEVVAVAQSYKDLFEERGETGVSHLIAKDGYRNKMFVRADLMPHQIRITSVRIERIQDISDDDCLREGIIEYATCSECGSDLYSFAGATDAYYGPREAFAALIDKISGKGTWDSNPWVFVYEFEKAR